MKTILTVLLTLMCSPLCAIEPAELAAFIESTQKTFDDRQLDDNAARVFVAISLSMPKSSLLRLAEDARDADVALVVRGVNIEETPAQDDRPRSVRERFGLHILTRGLKDFAFLTETGVKLAIDPRLFTTYAIDAVPTLIVADHRPSTKAMPRHLRVTGDVTLAYALRYLKSNLKSKATDTFEMSASQAIDKHLDRLGERP